MSLIGYTLNYDFPFLVGDLLISSNELVPSFTPPTTRGTTKKEVRSIKPSYVPHSANQKIYIVKRNLCVALAGDVEKMKLFLREFRIRCSYYDDVTKAHVEQFLHDYGDVKQLSAVILLVDRSDNKERFERYHTGKWENVNSEVFECGYATGSGSTAFLREVKDGSTVLTTKEGNEPEKSLSTALLHNLSLVGRLLGLERYASYTLNDHWGGGFELIFYDGTTFKKIDETTFIIWHGKLDDRQHITFKPTVCLHYKYDNEILNLVCIESTREHLYQVQPIDWVESDLPKKDPSMAFEAKRIVNSYIIEFSNGLCTAVTSIPSKREMQVSYSNKNLHISGVDKDQKKIFRNVKEMYPYWERQFGFQ